MQYNVEFDLQLPINQKELQMPLLLARGYNKANVIECFTDLERNGYGTFIRGSRGKGKFGKFIPNDNCPKQYYMSFEAKRRGRKRKMIED